MLQRLEAGQAAELWNWLESGDRIVTENYPAGGFYKLDDPFWSDSVMSIDQNARDERHIATVLGKLPNNLR